MSGDVPLLTLLSQTLVAYTIEFDNEFEHRMPHRTTRGERRGGPWLVSMAMWLNCMQFVPDEGIALKELEARARTTTNLRGMTRWGYVTAGSDGVIRTTTRGREAQGVWREVASDIEQRWHARFEAVETLRQLLTAIVERSGLDLPDCLPILGYGLFSKVAVRKTESVIAGNYLPALLSKVLLLFALEFERESDLALSVAANLLRVLDDRGVRVAELPVRTGVSKEAIQVAMGLLQKKALVKLEKDGRLNAARLTAKGSQAQADTSRLIATVEEEWRPRFGAEKIDALRGALTEMNGRFAEGLEPYPDGWRASVPAAATLPHFPMVLHRGGFPDGS